MKGVRFVTYLQIPPDLRALHERAWKMGSSDWEICSYSLPAHPLTDAIGDVVGLRGQGIACGFARLHQDNDSCWRGMQFLSLVITGRHWIDAAMSPVGNGESSSVIGQPGHMFVLNPKAWHCAIPWGSHEPLRLAQWEVPTRKLARAVRAIRAMGLPG